MASILQSRFVVQTWLLLKKNLKVSLRNKQATITQVLVPIIFVASLFFLQIFTLEANEAAREVIESDGNPNEHAIGPYPPCIVHPNTVGECITIAWVTNEDAALTSIAADAVEWIRDANGIDAVRVRQFETADDLDVYLNSHRNSTVSGLLFEATYTGNTVTHLDYVVQYNYTDQSEFGIAMDSEMNVLVPVTYWVERALLHTLVAYDASVRGRVSVPDVTFDVSYRKFAHPELFPWDIIGEAGPAFFYAALCFNFVVQMGSLVRERSLQLRVSMTIMGMNNASYWLSWGINNACFNIVSVIEIVIVGAIFQFSFFIDNSFFAYFFLFFLFAMAMVTMAFFCASFVSNPESATSFGFMLFLLGTITQIFQDLIFEGDNDLYKSLFALFPPVLLSKGIVDISSAGDATGETGFSWSDRFDNSNFPLVRVYYWLIADFFIYAVLTWYFDNILDTGHGTPEPPYFFLTPSYWRSFCTKPAPTEWSSDASDSEMMWPFTPRPATLEAIGSHGSRTHDDPQVIAEIDMMQNMDLPHDTALAIFGLRKVFRTTRGCCHGCCCGVCGHTDFEAVKEINLHVPNDSLLCLLGFNGAGKTTLMRMLVGLHSISEGEAFIYGHSVRHEISAIRSIMGVCPQHDILWERLTGREHLRLFAVLKGVPEAEVEAEVEARLEDVGLTEAGDGMAGTYSGGMQRRLSTAIAFVADPRIVFLDEPTTGMDPVSRRAVWSLIQQKKAGRCIILTTHSMEEADILSSRIAIMSLGHLAALGTALQLKSGEFATGSLITMIMGEDDEFEDPLHVRQERVMAFMNDVFGDLPPVNAVHDLRFIVPRNRMSRMSRFFRRLEAEKDDLGIVDFTLNFGDLESVFLNLAASLGVGDAEGVYGKRGDDSFESLHNSYYDASSITGTD